MIDEEHYRNEKSFLVADDLARMRESEIISMLTHYFGEDQWDEDMLNQRCNVILQPAGETFHIDGVPLLHLGPIIPNTTIEREGPTVKMTFAQSVRRIYEEVD